ncbi:hypothetical protein [Brevibacterium otitidis]|uniref:FtsX-like permease family protein n=1 Tax=Brevibacterium otitidis TaxID=53364 RepID=A0ABV5WXT7_9MICO|nr:hypothetical protein GCM10023233_21850 [Brevibacterium otitidis]
MTMTRRRTLMTFAPLAFGGLALALFAALMAYLFVFDSMLGLPVSTLDGPGPTWPMTAATILLTCAVIALPTGGLWAAAVTVTATRRNAQPRPGNGMPEAVSVS